MNIEKLLKEIPDLDAAARKRIIDWLEDDVDPKARQEVLRLIHEDQKGLIDAFYTTLSFGTGGLRGIMGPGSNRMNEHTVSAATQGLANYMLKTLPNELLRVAIGYDSRHQSSFFAKTAATVLSANGIQVFLFEALRPTPLVSFACRYKTCGAAIMITASHNPANYNGYKVYWSDGAQVLPPHDIGIIKEVSLVQARSQIKKASFPNERITMMGQEVDEAYLGAITPFLFEGEVRDQLRYNSKIKILYSSLHGTGITMVPKALERFGFSNIGHVEEQKEPNGDFPTTVSPNPEEMAALQLGINKLEHERYDLFIATDPDCDRIGVVVRHHDKAVRLTGNEVACIACDFVCKKYKLSNHAACVKTIVTSDLFRVICDSYQVACFEVLTGFKYIAQKIREWESQKDGYRYLFGGEESYGYLLGTHVRDKDAVILACLLAEIAAFLQKEGKTFVDYLHELYKTHGVYRERLCTIEFEEGKIGKEKQKQLLDRLRTSPPTSFAGCPVKCFVDYKFLIRKDFTDHTEEKILLPSSDVLLFELEDRSKIFVRPSGTEPKTKIYLMAHEVYKEGSIETAIARCDAKLERFKEVMLSIENK